MCYLGYPWIAWCKDISPWNDVNEGVRRRVSSADGETKIESPNASRMFQLDMARREPQFCSSFDEPFWNKFFSGYTFLTHTARKNALFCRQKVHIFDLKTMKAATTRYSGTQWNAVERLDIGFLSQLGIHCTGWCPPVMWTLVYKPHEYYSYICHKP